MPETVRQTEYLHRKAADRAGDAVAVKLERRVVGRADVGDDVHFHAVDDGKESPRAEAESLAPLAPVHAAPTAECRRRSRDVVAPAGKLATRCRARTSTVGNVVDGATERIDFEHGVALRLRQDAHRRVERAAGRALSAGGGLVGVAADVIGRDLGQAGRGAATRSAAVAPCCSAACAVNPSAASFDTWTRSLSGSRCISTSVR